MAIIKIIELIAESDKSWEDAAEKAVENASKQKQFETFNQFGLGI
jgi:flavin-binding protein dodecin